VLCDPAFVVVPSGSGGAVGTLAWLRGAVSRFASGSEHARRRALVVAELDAIPVGPLREQAADAVRGGVAPGAVPVRLLAAVLGVPAAGLEEVASAAAAIAPWYLEGATDAARPAADRAVRSLLAALRPDPTATLRASPLALAADRRPPRGDAPPPRPRAGDAEGCPRSGGARRPRGAGGHRRGA